MDSKYTNYELSLLVKQGLETKGWSLRFCCNHFNNKRLGDIKEGKIKPIDKDFIRRITANDFKVQSDRVLDFCDFLEINVLQKFEGQIQKNVFHKEVETIEKAVKQKPELEKTVRNLLENIALIANTSTLQGS